MEVIRLLASEREKLEEILNDFSFTCGAPLQDLEMEGKLADVYTRNISCREPVEKLYYVAKYPAICVYCAEPYIRLSHLSTSWKTYAKWCLNLSSKKISSLNP